MAPESPDAVPEPDSEAPLEPEPVVAVAASRDAVEAAEPPAEIADWVTSESSCGSVSKVSCLPIRIVDQLTELPEAVAEASLRKLEYAEALARLPAAEPAATPLVPLVGMGMMPEPAAVPPGK